MCSDLGEQKMTFKLPITYRILNRPASKTLQVKPTAAHRQAFEFSTLDYILPLPPHKHNHVFTFVNYI